MSQLALSTMTRYWPGSTIAGPLLFAALILMLLHSLKVVEAELIATLLAWLFVIIELPRLKKNQRNLIGMLAFVGIVGATIAMNQGSTVSVEDLLTAHMNLLMLLASVHFIALVTQLEKSQTHRGMPSFSLSLGCMHLISSVTSFSSVVLVGDQIKRNQTLDQLSQQLLSRGFALSVLWSPFLAMLPFTLEQVPNTELSQVYPFMILMAVLGLIITLLEARFRTPDALSVYDGYPMKSSTLLLPAGLMLGVFGLKLLLPTLPTLAAVALMALFVPLALLLWRNGMTQAGTQFVMHIRDKLADTRGEISLFLCAGVLAAGTRALIETGLVSLPVTETDATVASVVLVMMVLLALSGVHQLALVAIFASLLESVTTTPVIMTVAYVLAACLAMSSSTFSGLSFILQARFNCRARDLLKANLPYTGVMLLLGILLLHGMQWIGIK